MIEQVSSVQCFGGEQRQYQHQSKVLNCAMHFSVFLPPQAQHESVPVLYWLSGLTCTDQNFVTKAGAQQYAADLGIAIVCPDTSPRGDDVPDDPDGAYDFGLGAGFYLNATQSPWDKHYRMHDYIVIELPELIGGIDGLDASRAGISGHSMGGHGALTIGLKHPEHYSSISAFSPLVAPSQVPWGEKALGNYLGSDQSTWLEYDACALLAEAQEHTPILIDQGTADNFLEEQLKTHLLQEAAQSAGYPVSVRIQEGYDHSYFFIATFIQSHLEFHSEYLA